MAAVGLRKILTSLLRALVPILNHVDIVQDRFRQVDHVPHIIRICAPLDVVRRRVARQPQCIRLSEKPRIDVTGTSEPFD